MRFMQNTSRLAVTLAFFLSSAATVQAAETIRLLSSFGENVKPTYANLLIFQKQLEEVSNGEMVIEIAGPEAVPPLEQLQPVTAGAFDMLYTHGAYHSGSKGLSQALDAIQTNVDKRRESGVWEYVDEFYQQEHGLRLVSIATMGTYGYHCYMREPLTNDDDWEGRRFRSVVSYDGVIRALGGEPVVMPINEVYVGLERGMIDGTCGPAAGMHALKHYEVAKYRLEPTFGGVNTVFFINNDRWNSLSEQQQEWLMEAGYNTEVEALAIGDGFVEDERAALAKEGVEVTKLPDDKGEMIQKVWDVSQWETAEKCCGDAAKELRNIASKAGMTN